MKFRRFVAFLLTLSLLICVPVFSSPVNAAPTSPKCSSVYMNTARAKYSEKYADDLVVLGDYYLKTDGKSGSNIIKLKTGTCVKCYGNYMTADSVTGYNKSVGGTAKSKTWLLVTITTGGYYYYGWFPASLLAY